MFSVIFPGQGSQTVGMGQELYNNFNLVKKIFKEADDILGFSISKLILEGPKEKLNLTENTQPSIFLLSYSIFNLLKEEFSVELNNAKFFAGHSLGEYSALCCSKSISFSDAISILKIRGESMQAAVPQGEGSMAAVLGKDVNQVEKIIKNSDIENVYIANDNSNTQIVISGLTKDVEKIIEIFKKDKIKALKLPVSAPFHCPLMKKSTEIMRSEIENVEFKNPINKIISNVTGKEELDGLKIKNLLIEQIEKRVKWRESINYIASKGVSKYIEIGPGKVLSSMIKRMNKNFITISINSLEDCKNLKI